ncbi:uncharacterized protein B0J16DRAFT_368172 [Fusarium flagelliforme]|uniref:Uncharacterized protein n=1 Tax=Fusarium flagelliforme TaxID=2675880 RepID=A0A395MCI1_9HYPO|nr:uncharacterized protein B0J16DRAFT_368172 [Fusarium flagelliforme]KAH7191862.1 hypothetical protein B0J16DRAFT_368172 [Fusarium flagelliforme]RFN45520.1 hypothetical protein FIE12Z_10283 [Fusarium flagelliforme]
MKALFLWLTLATASITIPLSPVAPLPLREGIATSAEDLFKRSCPEEVASSVPYTPSLLASSFEDVSHVYPSSGGFIRGAVEAWAQHQHFVIRPDEVWFEVLSQMNLYMSANSEKLRDMFVEFDGKEKIVVEGDSWEGIIVSFGDEMNNRVKTKWLKDWILPNFTTSTPQDDVTATILMMGLMKTFFDFEGMIICGIPSVTLLGEREDWVKLRDKLDRLYEFGDDAGLFADALKPIMKRFVSSWDGDEETKEFWEQIVRAKKKWSCGEGASEWDVSGWITGFQFFERDGKRRGFDPWADEDEDEEEESVGEEKVEEEKVEEEKVEEEKVEEEIKMGIFPNDWNIVMDGQSYLPVSLSDLSTGYAKAPLKMKGYPQPGVDTDAYLLAGNVGVERTEEEGRVEARPVSGWFLYGPVDTNYTVGPFFGSGEEMESVAVGIAVCKDVIESGKATEGKEEVKDL